MIHFIKTMAPGWFASVMGTSVSAIAFHLAADLYKLEWLEAASDFMHYAAIAMMIVLGAAAILRIAIYPKKVLETIKHPVEGCFYATFPVAMLVMAAEWSVRGASSSMVAALWWSGSVLILLVGYLVLFYRFTKDRLVPSNVTPALFIPAVGLVVVPVAGAGLAESAQGAMRELYFGINMMTMGAGVFMYLGLLALNVARHFLAEPIVGKITPALFIHMAPLGVIPLSMLSLLHALGDEALMAYGLLVSALFLGAAVWMFVLVSAVVLNNWRLGKLPFALSWWAFVFPVGGVSVLAVRLSSFMHLELLPYLAGFLLAVLAVLWAAAAAGTISGLVKGTIIPKSE